MTSNKTLQDEDDLFYIQENDHYDFAEDLKDVEFEIGFDGLRSLQNVCLLPNLDLLIEGPLMDQTVEVYKISADKGANQKPDRIIKTNARGLNAIAFNEDIIYMGFMGSLISPNLVIQIYNYDYSLVHEVEYPLTGNGFTDFILAMDGKFLIGSHHGGTISVYDADECTVQVFDEPFGYVETIWSLEKVGNMGGEGSVEYFVAATTYGVYVLGI